MWLSVSLQTDAAHADDLSDALLASGALSVSVEDALAGTPAETAQFAEPGAESLPQWQDNRVIALFSPDTDISQCLAAAAEQAGITAGLEPQITEVAEQDWVRLSQSQFAPIRISQRLWIVPSWHTPPDADSINIELDPGQAFGTGSHPTTRLCLEFLEQYVAPGLSLLDYGCGSGILGIAAAKLGIGQTIGVDIDPAALEVAAANAERNRVQLQFLHSDDLAESLQFDLVVANILANPLMLMAPLLAARLKPGGRIALSGILQQQADQLIACYAPLLQLQFGAECDGWVRLDGVKLTPC